MTDAFDPDLRLAHKIHRIDPTPTLLRRYRLLAWSSTVILVRHAEKGAGTDPPLSPAGQARAQVLRDMVQDMDLSAVFVTNTLRSRQTGQAVATGQGLAVSVYSDAAALAQTLRSGHAGRAVLVVAHSNTVDDVAGALGAPGVGELEEAQFDRMFILSRSWCGTRLTRLRYGASTP